MKKILLTIEYDGSKFCGWQIQKNAPSVEEVLEKELSKLLDEKITLFASGRTDSGVHALAQTAHFETNSNFPVEKLALAVNKNLNGVAILSAKVVRKKDFHARYSVKSKTYLYKTIASRITHPLLENRVAKVSTKVLQGLQNIKSASKYFLGTHDFSAFCAKGTSATNFVRTIYDIKIKKSGKSLDFYITGNGFLYNMVRILVGTLIAVGEGKISPEQIPEIILSKNRHLAGKTLPPHGLYLYKVKY